MDVKEAILDYIRRHGPSVPPAIASALKRDTVLVNAFLSELTRSGDLRYSHLMVGRSRLYYESGQEEKLQEYADYLSEKDRRSYEKLREGEVLRDRELDSLTRVSLRNIPDFAVPLEVTHNNQQELFWRFYQVSSKRAEELIRDMLGLGHTNELEATNGVSADGEATGEPAGMPEGTAQSQKQAPENPVEHPPAEPGWPEDEGSSLEEPQQAQKHGSAASSRKGRDSQKELFTQESGRDTENARVSSDGIEDEFAREVIAFLEAQGIRVYACEVIRKRSEVDLDILVPSPLGSLRYFCKGRNKKSINEGDLASAFVTGQLKHLPVIFVTPGKLTKKAQEKLEQEMQSITVSYIE